MNYQEIENYYLNDKDYQRRYEGASFTLGRYLYTALKEDRLSDDLFADLFSELAECYPVLQQIEDTYGLSCYRESTIAELVDIAVLDDIMREKLGVEG